MKDRDDERFSKKARKFIRGSQPGKSLENQPAQAAECTAEHHVLASDGDTVEENLLTRCKCGRYTLKELLEKRSGAS